MQHIRLQLLALLLLGTVAACQPQIGDSCASDIECGGGQVCETSSPAGYCTEYDCEPNGCPPEAVCVDFGVRSACMRRCSSSGDCRRRDGYRCIDGDAPVSYCFTEEDAPQSAPGGTPQDGSGEGSGLDDPGRLSGDGSGEGSGLAEGSGQR